MVATKPVVDVVVTASSGHLNIQIAFTGNTDRDEDGDTLTYHM